jgi:membrane protein YdbS with pleckstrin-like domain
MGVSSGSSLPWSRTSTSKRTKGQADTESATSEQVVAELRRHDLGLLGIGVRVVIAAALLGVAWAALDSWQLFGPVVTSILKWTVLGIACFYLLFGIVTRFMRWSNARTVITNQRVLIRYRLREPGWEIPLLSIAGVSYSRGPIERLFGVGQLQIQTTFAPSAAVVNDVDDVKTTCAELLALRDRAWAVHTRRMAGYPGASNVAQTS